SYLLIIWWTERKAKVINDVESKAGSIDEEIAEINRAWQYTGSPLAGPLPTYAGRGLSAALDASAGGVLGMATVLDRDDTCVGRALDRVYNKLRPSHSGMVKDSIHLEHYLEFCRQLHG